MTFKNLVIGILALGVLVFGYLYFTGGNSPLAGAVNPTGPQHFQMEAFIQGLCVGGANQFCLSNVGDETSSALHTWTGVFSSTGANTLFTLTIGGGQTATSTTATVGTMQSSEIDAENFYKMTPNTAAMTLTLPASTTVAAKWAKTVGTTHSILVYNATTSSYVNGAITIANGTGTTLLNASTTAATTQKCIIAPQGIAKLDFVFASSSYAVLCNIYQ